MRITRAVVPSLFTVLNAVCGFLSIVDASKGDIQMAAWFIIMAAIFDALDGVMARITKSSSQFGVELDSLADVVSFGAAPSFMVYQAHLNTLNTLGLIISAMPVVLGAIRLARFNVQLVGFEKDHFKGLPIPFQAITVCAFILQFYSVDHGLRGLPASALAPMVVLLSMLMVTKIRYSTLPKLSRKGIKAHPWRVGLFLLAGLLIIGSMGKLLFAVLMAFLLFGVLRSGVEWIRRAVRGIAEEEEEEHEVSSIDI
jgi:CDP-diacylglycerol---serine O-phosphatidyltransferase